MKVIFNQILRLIGSQIKFKEIFFFNSFVKFSGYKKRLIMSFSSHHVKQNQIKNRLFSQTEYKQLNSLDILHAFQNQLYCAKN